MKIVFVGDEPSSKNVDPSRAFYGTKSLDVLAGWAFWLGVDKTRALMINSHTADLVETTWKHYMNGLAIIALGNKASKRLSDRGVPHFKLPHPSGRNRKLNNREYVDSELTRCYLYLKERQCVSSVKTGN